LAEFGAEACWGERAAMARWFTMIYPEVNEVKACLDGIVFFANPAEKDAAHITIRGPANVRSGITKIPELIKGERIAMLGVGTFFAAGQNTVFFKCGADKIRRYWDKPEYPFNPHMTIYDGNSRQFAEKLMFVLSRYRLFFEIVVGDCRIVNSVPGQKSMHLALDVDKKELENITGENIQWETVSNFPDWRRLNFIDRCCNRLLWNARKGLKGIDAVSG
jgi:hypothetical protein